MHDARPCLSMGTENEATQPNATERSKTRIFGYAAGVSPHDAMLR